METIGKEFQKNKIANLTALITESEKAIYTENENIERGKLDLQNLNIQIAGLISNGRSSADAKESDKIAVKRNRANSFTKTACQGNR